MKPAQYTLPFQPVTDYAPGRYGISDANSQAHAWIARWPDWPGNALLLSGPKGAGKTHLAHIWQALSGAAFLPLNPLSALPDGAAIVEDIEHTQDETSLFHLLNHARANQIPLLLTTSAETGNLPFRLPDLLSRLRALPLASLAAPDDALLIHVLEKALQDRQLTLEPGVMEYLLPRMERSFAHAHALAAALDALSLATGRRVTIPLARECLEGMT